MDYKWQHYSWKVMRYWCKKQLVFPHCDMLSNLIQHQKKWWQIGYIQSDFKSYKSSCLFWQLLYHLYRNPKIYKRRFKELKICITALQKYNWDNALLWTKVLDLSTGSSVEMQRSFNDQSIFQHLPFPPFFHLECFKNTGILSLSTYF